MFSSSVTRELEPEQSSGSKLFAPSKPEPQAHLVNEGSKLVVQTLDLFLLFTLHTLRIGVDAQVEGCQQALIDRDGSNAGGAGPTETPCSVTKAAPAMVEGPFATPSHPRRPRRTQAPAAKHPKMPIAKQPRGAAMKSPNIEAAMSPWFGHHHGRVGAEVPDHAAATTRINAEGAAGHAASRIGE